MSKIETKSISEWKTVYSVYDRKNYTIIGTDRPDFSVTRIETQYSIGVEVTSLYFHDASARLKNNNAYLQKFLEGKIHKGDKNHLYVDTIELLERRDVNNNPIAIEGVVYAHPSIGEFLDLVSKAVQSKDNKYRYLSSGFKKIELIITDEENYFASWNTNDVSSNLFQNESLNNIIQHSVFNEIYFVSNFFGTTKILPLKKALFISKLYLIYYYLLNEEKKDYIHSEFVLIILSMLKCFGYFDIKGFRESETVTCIIYENYQIQINRLDVGFRIENYNQTFDDLLPINLSHEKILNYVCYFENISGFTKKHCALLDPYMIDLLS